MRSTPRASKAPAQPGIVWSSLGFRPWGSGPFPSSGPASEGVLRGCTCVPETAERVVRTRLLGKCGRGHASATWFLRRSRPPPWVLGFGGPMRARKDLHAAGVSHKRKTSCSGRAGMRRSVKNLEMGDQDAFESGLCPEGWRRLRNRRNIPRPRSRRF